MRMTVMPLILAAAPLQANAQDMMSSMMAANAANQAAYMNTHIANLSLGNVADEARRGDRSTPDRRRLAPPRPRIAGPTTFAYTSTPALRRQVVDQAVQRAARVKPEYGTALAGAFARQDYAAIFGTMARTVGLNAGNAVDVLAVNMAVKWVIANGVERDPTPAQVRGLARQLAGAAGGAPNMANPAARARTAEEMKLQTVILDAGWQASKREGNRAMYARSIADDSRRMGLDLTRLDLTPAGLVPRR